MPANGGSSARSAALGFHLERTNSKPIIPTEEHWRRCPQRHRLGLGRSDHKLLHLPEPNQGLWESHRRPVVAVATTMSLAMSSNLEQVGRNHPPVRGGTPPTPSRTSVDVLSNGYSPSVTIRPPERAVAGSKPGPLRSIGSLKIGAGIWNDIRSRIPYYTSDWTDAWNYRVVPATTLIFFAKYGGFSTEPPGLHDLPFQCSSWDCFLLRSHRDYWRVWCCGGLTFLCRGCRRVLGIWWTTAVHSRRYGHVLRRRSIHGLKMLTLPS